MGLYWDLIYSYRNKSSLILGFVCTITASKFSCFSRLNCILWKLIYYFKKIYELQVYWHWVVYWSYAIIIMPFKHKSVWMFKWNESLCRYASLKLKLNFNTIYFQEFTFFPELKCCCCCQLCQYLTILLDIHIYFK